MPKFYCPKCKAPGMSVDNTPAMHCHFNGDGDLVDSDFANGPGEYDDDDTACCRRACGYEGHPADFEHDEEEDGDYEDEDYNKEEME